MMLHVVTGYRIWNRHVPFAPGSTVKASVSCAIVLSSERSTMRFAFTHRDGSGVRAAYASSAPDDSRIAYEP